MKGTDLGGRRPRHRVIALLDVDGKVRHLGVASADRPAPWRLVWENRQTLNSSLSIWMRRLEREPEEVVLLGKSTGLHATTARNVARLLAGWFGVSVDDAIHCRRRTVARIDGSKLTVWPSIAAAAREMGVTRSTILRHIRQGRLLDGGWRGTAPCRRTF